MKKKVTKSEKSDLVGTLHMLIGEAADLSQDYYPTTAKEQREVNKCQKKMTLEHKRHDFKRCAKCMVVKIPVPKLVETSLTVNGNNKSKFTT